MKNIKLIIAALASFAALSCEKVETTTTNPETNPEDGLVTLTLSTGEATKTHISNVIDSEGKTEIHWDEGDAIKVFTDETYWGNNAFSFSMSETPNGNFARFGGKIAATSTKFWAVYPENKAVSCSADGDDLKVSIPSSQSTGSVPNSFASNINVSVAKGVINEVNNGILGSGDYELNEPISVTFKNVCSLLKFTAPANASEITSVTISANEVIAGEMTIDYSGDEPKVTGVSGSKSITMTGSFTSGKDYYFVLAPVNLSGISMTIKTNTETKFITKKASIALKSGVVKNLGNVNLTTMTKISAVAAHQTIDGVLSGTNINFNLGALEVKNVAFSVTGSRASRKVTAISSKYNNDSTWPYLPQGSYTFSGSFSSGGVYVSVPATSFTVPVLTESQLKVSEFTPFTSYSKYLENKSKEANSLDGSAIYVNVTHNISPNIIANTNYSQLITVEGNTPVYNSDKSCVCFAGRDWKSHTVSEITWTFDGVSVTKEIAAKTVYVTGIPYTLSPSKEDSGWTKSGTVKWNQTIVEANLSNPNAGTAVKLGDANSGSSSISRTFPLPASTNVTISAKCTATATAYAEKVGTTWLGTSKYEYWYYENIGSVCVGDKVIASANTKQQTNVMAYVNPREVQFKADNYVISLDGKTSIVCSNSHDANSCYTGIYSLEVKYKE